MIAGCISLGTDLPGSSLGEAASVTVVYRLLVPVGLWLTVPEERLFEARDFMKNNFFLYAVHFALVRLINKTAGRRPDPAFDACRVETVKRGSMTSGLRHRMEVRGPSG